MFCFRFAKGMKMIEIKTLSPERWREARDLRLRSLKTDPAAFGSSYEEEEKLSESDWRERTKNALYAVSEEDKIVGSITFIFSDRVKSKHIANIYGFYVDQNFRGRGAGRMLLEKALELIRKNQNIVKVKLMVNPRQEAAFALYKSVGFVIVGEMKKEMKIGDTFYDEFAMEKMLD